MLPGSAAAASKSPSSPRGISSGPGCREREDAGADMAMVGHRRGLRASRFRWRGWKAALSFWDQPWSWAGLGAQHMWLVAAGALRGSTGSTAPSLCPWFGECCPGSLHLLHLPRAPELLSLLRGRDPGGRKVCKSSGGLGWIKGFDSCGSRELFFAYLEMLWAFVLGEIGFFL